VGVHSVSSLVPQTLVTGSPHTYFIECLGHTDSTRRAKQNQEQQCRATAAAGRSNRETHTPPRQNLVVTTEVKDINPSPRNTGNILTARSPATIHQLTPTPSVTIPQERRTPTTCLNKTTTLAGTQRDTTPMTSSPMWAHPPLGLAALTAAKNRDGLRYPSASSRRAGASHPQTTPSSTYRSTNTAARSPGREIIPYQNPADRASSPSDSDSTLVIDAPRSTETQSDRRHRPRHRDRERAYAYDDYSYTPSSSYYPDALPPGQSHTGPSEGYWYGTSSNSRQRDRDYSSYHPSSRRSRRSSTTTVTTSIYIPLRPGDTYTVNLPPVVLR
jgi:hypothetical protein